MTKKILPLAAAVLIAACGDSIPGPGTLTATIVSPHQNEGAAVVRVTGPGLTGEVSERSGRVWAEPRSGSMTVVVLAEPASILSFGFAVEDTTADFTAEVLEVAGPTDALRGFLGEYEVEIAR